MKVVNVVINGVYTDGYSYQENLLPKYHKINGNDTYIITSNNKFSSGDNIVKTVCSEYYDENGVKIIRLPLKNNKKVTDKIKKLEGLFDKLEEIKPDIIFYHLFQSVDVKTIIRYKKMHPEVKVFFDSHADFSNSAHTWLSKNILHKVIWKHYAKLAIPYVEKFYGVLPARVEFLKQMYGLPSEKCELLVMGGDDELIEKTRNSDVRNKIRGKFNIKDNDFLIVTGGKIDHYKPQTLNLMKLVKEQKVCAKLLIFGSVEKDMENAFYSLVDNQNVYYAGWIKSSESYDYFESSDLVVFPGRHSVFWEQVTAQGKPMICKKWHGTTHVDLGGNVIFLENDDEDLLLNSIRECICDGDKYSRMISIAKDKGTSYFSYKEIARRSIRGNCDGR